MNQRDVELMHAHEYFMNIFRSVLEEELLHEVWLSGSALVDSPHYMHFRKRSVHDVVEVCVLQAIELLDSATGGLQSPSRGVIQHPHSKRFPFESQCSAGSSSLDGDSSIRNKKNTKHHRSIIISSSNKSTKRVYNLSELSTIDLTQRNLNPSPNLSPSPSPKELQSLYQLQEVFSHDKSRYPEKLLLDTLRSFDCDLNKSTNFLLSYEPCYIGALLQSSDASIPIRPHTGSASDTTAEAVSKCLAPSQSGDGGDPASSTGFITVQRTSRAQYRSNNAADSFEQKILAHFLATFKKNNPGALVAISDNRLMFMGLRLDRPTKRIGSNSFFNGEDYDHTDPLICKCNVFIDLHGLNVQAALSIVHSSMRYYYSAFDDILKVDSRLPAHNSDLNSVFQHMRVRSKGRVIIIRYVVGRGVHSLQGNCKLSGSVVEALQLRWPAVECRRQEGFVDVHLKK